MNARSCVAAGALVALALAGFMAVPHPGACAENGVRGLGAQLEGLVRECMTTGMTPGMAVAVVRGEEVWSTGLGMADREAKRPVTPGSVFYIASTTKALTATAAARVASRGELDLNAPISRALPGARLAKGVAAESILVRDLLTHTHGIDPNGPISLRVAFTGDYTNEKLLQLLEAHGPAKEGRAFQYSNLGYDLIGIVLAPSATGGWKAVVEREVLLPLGMYATTAYRSRVSESALAQPYEMGPDGFERIPLAKEDANIGPAGGHFSTAPDLARLLAAEIHAGTVDGAPAIPPGVIAETQRLQATQDRAFGPFHRHGWGLGWDLGTYESDTLVHRFGSFPGYRSHVSFMPRRDIGVVVLVNGGGASSSLADIVATAIYDRLIGRADAEQRLQARLVDLKVEHAKQMAAITADRAKRAARSQVLPRPAGDYIGTFVSPMLGSLTLQLGEDGRLQARMGVARSPVEVYDAEKNELRVELFGRGSVLAVAFPTDGGSANGVSLMGMPFRRE